MLKKMFLNNNNRFDGLDLLYHSMMTYCNNKEILSGNKTVRLGQKKIISGANKSRKQK